MKTKNFVLDKGRIGGAMYEILCRVNENGAFKNKGEVNIIDKETVKNTPSHKRCMKIKYHRRQRQMGFIPICPMPEKGDFVWHHIDKNRVVPVVRLVHENVPHTYGDGKLEGVLG